MRKWILFVVAAAAAAGFVYRRWARRRELPDDYRDIRSDAYVEAA